MIWDAADESWVSAAARSIKPSLARAHTHTHTHALTSPPLSDRLPEKTIDDPTAMCARDVHLRLLHVHHDDARVDDVRGWTSNMTKQSELVRHVSHLLESRLPLMLSSLQQRKQQMHVGRLDAHTAQAELVPHIRDELAHAFHEANAACTNARSNVTKPGLWDELLSSSIWTLVHSYILAHDSVDDAFDRLDVALCLVRSSKWFLCCESPANSNRRYSRPKPSISSA